MTLVGEAGRWRERLAVVAAVLLVLAAVTYVTRRSLLQSVARIALSRDSDMVARERADGSRLSLRSRRLRGLHP